MNVSANETEWVEVTTASSLEEKGKLLYRHEEKQIALFWGNGRLFAVDNRCPHQGYPLREGTLDQTDGDGESCILTCQWHNWKFNARTGECLQGEDHVRAYPIERRGESIWIDLQEPSRESQRQQIMEGLRTAVSKRQFGRICRELARLVKAGFGLQDALRDILIWRSVHFEFGTTHAHAVTADWLALHQESEGDIAQQILCMAEAIDHIAHDTLRHPVYPFPDAIEAFDGDAFLEAIEAEDERHAIALARGALRAGLDWPDLEPWMARAALAHYNDFGHSLIYVQKLGEIHQYLGQTVTEALVLPLVRSLCLTQREDLIPMFRKYAHFLAEAPPLRDNDASQIPDTVRDILRDASVNQAMAWVNEQLTHRSVTVVYDALIETCARHLVHYDTRYQSAYDKPVGQHIGWLHLTHAVTFGHAVRDICERYPELWQAGLLQMACFAGRHQAFLDRHQEPSESHWYIDDAEHFFAQSIEQIFDHGLQAPIFSSHLVKTLLAIRAEVRRYDALPEQASHPQRADSRRYLLAAGHRFLQSPLKQKHVKRAVQQALVLADLP